MRMCESLRAGGVWIGPQDGEMIFPMGPVEVDE